MQQWSYFLHVNDFIWASGDAGDVDVGLATPLEVYQSLAAEGYQMSHRRVPLSRERTPEAADLDALHHQLLVQPEGKLDENGVMAAPWTATTCSASASMHVSPRCLRA